MLDNGLRLFVHEDHTSPIVTSQLVVHVGSARETRGRTGFAHLFEHMMFQGSSQVREGAFFQRVQAAGGSLNANTSADRTLYYEELPADQLELALWLEADRLGWLLGALDQATLDNQRDVVLEERKQSYEQRPYGGVWEALGKLCFPREHPYSWPTIGSAEDVRNATLDDVTSFFRTWYVPGNATLALAGDVDFDRAVELVERHYGPIPAGDAIAPAAKRPAPLSSSPRAYLEDRVPVPQLNLAWPTVHAGHEDAPALDLLLQVLSANRASVIDRALTVDERLATQVSASHLSRELAGLFHLALRPHDGVSLDELHARLVEVLEDTARRGVTQAELDRVRASHEAALVRGLERVSARASVLALNDRLRGDPDALERDVAARARVTPDQVTDALRSYVLGRDCAALSTVPEGSADRALAGSEPMSTDPAPAPRVDEAPLAPWVAPDARAHAEPALDVAPPHVVLPESWSGDVVGGATITSAPGGPLPLVRVRIAVPCGRLHQGAGRFGLASMTAQWLREGARGRDGNALQNELDAIGARLSTRAGEDETIVELDVPTKHVARGVEALRDVLLEPRFDDGDFERLRAERLQAIAARAANPSSIADDRWRAIVHGAETLRGGPVIGSAASVAALTSDAARELWRERSGPRGARVLHAGELDREALGATLAPLFDEWQSRGAVSLTGAVDDAVHEEAGEVRTHHVPVAGAKQSELRIGLRTPAYGHPDHHPLAVWNHAFGGHFSSRINRRLREELGLTYGARSVLSGGVRPGAWTASAAVRAEASETAVAEVLALFRAQLEDGVTEAELAFTKASLAKADARRFETLDARLAYLDQWTRFGIGPQYPIERRARRESFTVDEVNEAARRHFAVERLEVLVVG